MGENLKVGSQRTKSIERLRVFARVMETQWRIPFTRLRFGVDFLVGLIPLVGDLLTGLVSLWLIRESLKFNLPKSVYIRMLLNVGIDVLVGSLPVIGDVFDLIHKANQRNLKLVLRQLERSDLPPEEEIER